MITGGGTGVVDQLYGHAAVDRADGPYRVSAILATTIRDGEEALIDTGASARAGEWHPIDSVCEGEFTGGDIDRQNVDPVTESQQPDGSAGCSAVIGNVGVGDAAGDVRGIGERARRRGSDD